ncbi:hypothetical protein NHX12_014454 [Muraenolepis orangiensis]|uniref:Ig-like domain-containing protein n=1 Tax=Muraenolepis orangiensis TaxID=630683 RepID=A0A9Q0DBY5_9TELE|nr:hypothetical protein NHX12_014454 [Muraenolepis orangiensis]
MLGRRRQDQADSLHWLLQEPVLSGTLLDYPGWGGAALSRQLRAAGVYTLGQQWFTEEGPRRLPVNTSLPMALIPCLALAVMLSTVTRCDAGRPSCGPLIEKSVGDDVEIGTCSSGRITEAYWKYGNHKITKGLVGKDDSQFKGRVHAITDVAVRELNSTRSRSESCVTWLQCTSSSSDSGAERGNYTWAVGNQTYAGARLKYASREAEETATCTVSNPVSRGSASVQLECSNGTDGSMRRDKSFTQLWVYVLSGLGVGLLTLVLVWLLLRRSRRTKAAPDAEENLYDDLENVPVKDNRRDVRVLGHMLCNEQQRTSRRSVTFRQWEKRIHREQEHLVLKRAAGANSLQS